MIRIRSMLILAILVGGCAAITVALAAKPSGGGPTAIAFMSMQQRVSPDDTSLVFTRADATRSQLATHNLASGSQSVLIQEDARKKKLFAPDWRRIP